MNKTNEVAKYIKKVQQFITENREALNSEKVRRFTESIKEKETRFPGVIIGQEAICQDGLGRVIDYCAGNWIQVQTYINDRSCKWDPKNVELINPRWK